MYLRDNMHLNLCQELKIYLPQALLTMLVMCWLIHCNFSFLPPCHVYSLFLSHPKHCYKSLSYSTPSLIKQNHSRSQLMYLYNLKWFLLSLFYQILSALEKQSRALCSKLFLYWCSKSPRVFSLPVRQMGNFVTISVTFEMAVLDEFNMKMKFWLK